MLHLVTIAVATLNLAAAPDAGVFKLKTSDPASRGPGATASKLVPTKTEAAMKFFVVEKDKGPVKGVVICMTSPDGTRYYTEETDAEGFAEVLVPVGQKYEVTYLSLGRKDIAANVTVTGEPKQTIKLTLRFKKMPPPPPFVLTGITFDTGKTTIKPESTDKLDVLAEFMRYKKRARVEISGHTDNVGKPKSQQGAVGQARERLPRLRDVQGHRRQPHHRHRPRPGKARRPQRHRREPGEEPAYRGGGSAGALERTVDLSAGRGAIVAVFSILAGLTGCASLSPCPAEGGPTWTEWRTPSFRLMTAIDDDSAEELVSSFEELRLALLLAAWRGGRQPSQPIEVIVLRNRSEFDVIAPVSVGGFVTSQGPGGAVIVTYAGLVLMEDSVVKHELAHALAHQFGIARDAPDWFNEGLAEYLSTVRYVAGGTRVRFGDLAADRQRELQFVNPLRFEQLWQAPPPGLSSRFYATSWLLVHYLFNHEPKRFEAFQRALGGEGGARQAWDSAFPGFGGAEVDAALANYMHGGKFMSYEATRRKPSFAVVSQEITDPEVHALKILAVRDGTRGRR